jgi:hypothetical protein
VEGQQELLLLLHLPLPPQLVPAVEAAAEVMWGHLGSGWHGCQSPTWLASWSWGGTLYRCRTAQQRRRGLYCSWRYTF